MDRGLAAHDVCSGIPRDPYLTGIAARSCSRTAQVRRMLMPPIVRGHKPDRAPALADLVAQSLAPYWRSLLLMYRVQPAAVFDRG